MDAELNIRISEAYKQRAIPRKPYLESHRHCYVLVHTCRPSRTHGHHSSLLKSVQPIDTLPVKLKARDSIGRYYRWIQDARYHCELGCEGRGKIVLLGAFTPSLAQLEIRYRWIKVACHPKTCALRTLGSFLITLSI